MKLNQLRKRKPSIILSVGSQAGFKVEDGETSDLSAYLNQDHLDQIEDWGRGWPAVIEQMKIMVGDLDGKYNQELLDFISKYRGQYSDEEVFILTDDPDDLYIGLVG